MRVPPIAATRRTVGRAPAAGRPAIAARHGARHDGAPLRAGILRIGRVRVIRAATGTAGNARARRGMSECDRKRRGLARLRASKAPGGL